MLNLKLIYLLCSYWMGSQTAPNIYQYRIIHADEKSFVNVASDPDVNIDGDIKYVINPNITAKTKFGVSYFFITHHMHVHYLTYVRVYMYVLDW